MRKSAIVFSVLLAVVLVAGVMGALSMVQDSSSGVVSAYPPPATPDPFPTITVTSRIYLPLVEYMPCAEQTKKALAWAHRGSNADDLYRLCLPEDFLWHSWTPTAPATELSGTFLVSVKWPAQLDAFEASVPTTSTQVVLWGNECDRPDQCNLSVADTVDFFLDLQDHCPDCKYVCPMYSVFDDDGSISHDFYDAYITAGGDDDAIYAASMHVYNMGWNPYDSLDERLDAFYTNYLTHTGQGEKKVWITEIGWFNTCAPTQDHEIGDDLPGWFIEADTDNRIEYYFGYTTFTHEQDACKFEPYWEENSPYTGTLHSEIFARPYYDYD